MEVAMVEAVLVSRYGRSSKFLLISASYLLF